MKDIFQLNITHFSLWDLVATNFNGKKNSWHELKIDNRLLVAFWSTIATALPTGYIKLSSERTVLRLRRLILSILFNFKNPLSDHFNENDTLQDPCRAERQFLGWKIFLKNALNIFRFCSYCYFIYIVTYIIDENRNDIMTVGAKDELIAFPTLEANRKTRNDDEL